MSRVVRWPQAALGRWQATRTAQRADVQGLRALAVALVVLDHAAVPVLPGGFVGVDVFLVVSGYLITSLLLRELVTTGRVRIGAFYARRARRILPAATVVLSVVAVLAALVFPLARAARVADDVGWSALFLANVRFARQGTDYFESDLPPSPVQHFWSLAVEEQFYLFWPAALALTAFLATRAVRRTDQVQHAGPGDASSRTPPESASGSLGLVSVLVVVCWVASATWSVVLTATDANAAYFSTPARAWELGTGALLALAAARGFRVPDLARPVLAALGLGAIGLAAVAYGPETPFPGWQASLPVLGTAAVLLAGDRGRAHGPARLLTARPVTWLGDVSYSLYLWHWPVLVMGAAVLPATVSPAVAPARPVLLVAAAVVLAAASYYLVESRFRSPARVWSTTPRALLLWPVAVAVVLAAVGWNAHHRASVLDQRTAQAASFDPSSVPPELRTPRNGRPVHDAIAASLDRAAVAGPVPFPLRNDVASTGSDRPRFPSRCFALSAEEDSDLCRLGDVGADFSVVLLGDSHAQMWLPGLDEAGRREGFEVVPLVKFGCPPSDLRLRELDRPGDPEFTACYEWREWALEELRRLEPDVVTVISRAPPPGLILEPGVSAEQAWHDAVGRLAGSLRESVDRVVVGGDVSYLRIADPAVCVGDATRSMRDCTLDVDPVTKTFNRASRHAATRAGAYWANLNALVCTAGRCPMVVNDVMTYHDGQHVSATWAVEVSGELTRLLKLAPGAARASRAS